MTIGMPAFFMIHAASGTSPTYRLLLTFRDREVVPIARGIVVPNPPSRDPIPSYVAHWQSGLPAPS